MIRIAQRWVGAALVASACLLGRGGRAWADDAAVVDLVVVEAEEKPVPGALVTAWQRGRNSSGASEWPASQSKTDAAGRARLTRLDARRAYRLEVIPPADRTSLALFDQGTWKPTSETVRLVPGFTVQGTVKDPLGRPLDRVTVCRPVHVRAADGTTTTGDCREVGRQGTFEFRHVPRGRVPLRASRRDARFDEHDVALAVATPEKPRVDLVLAKDDESARVVRRIEGMTPGRRAFLIPIDEPERDESSEADEREEPEAPGPPGSGSPPELTPPPGAVFVRVLPTLHVEADGTFRLDPTFDSLLSTLWVPPLSADDDHCLYVPEVGFLPSAAPLRLGRGQSIRGRLKGAVPGPNMHVFVEGPDRIEVPGVLEPTGTFVVRGLPEGRWPVVVGDLVTTPTAAGAALSTRERGRVVAQTGSEVEVEVK